MKITTFNPLIVTKDASSAIALFEELGFQRRHTKEGISINNVTDVRMKDANGHHVDIAEGQGEWPSFTAVVISCYQTARRAPVPDSSGRCAARLQ